MSSALADMLADEAILLDASAADWRDAIRQAGALLDRSGVAGEDYTRAMIDSAEEHGPYIVLTPGFALAHARPIESVRRTGLSWVRLSEPVEFGHAENDPVSLVVGLAAVDDSSHTSAMAELAGVLADESAMARLQSAQTPAQLKAVLSGDEAPSGAAYAAGSRSVDQHLILTVCGNGLGTSLPEEHSRRGALDVGLGQARHGRSYRHHLGSGPREGSCCHPDLR